VIILELNSDSSWTVGSFDDCVLGVNSVSFGPFTSDGVKRISTGGCDNQVRLYYEVDGVYQKQNLDPVDVSDTHKDWVRDVSFAPNIGLPVTEIASASEDGSVKIWSQSGETFG